MQRVTLFTDKDSIEIKQMTAKEEDILTSRTLLKERCCTRKTVTKYNCRQKKLIQRLYLLVIAMQLLLQQEFLDMVAIILVSVQCPACGTKQTLLFES